MTMLFANTHKVGQNDAADLVKYLIKRRADLAASVVATAEIKADVEETQLALDKLTGSTR